VHGAESRLQSVCDGGFLPIVTRIGLLALFYRN
jgi:hypothetical protein